MQETREHQLRQQMHYQQEEINYKRQEEYHHKKSHQECHLALKTSSYEEHKDMNPDHVPGTCRWVLNNPMYQAWRDKPQNDLLWISADPGCGKSVLSKLLVDQNLGVAIGTPTVAVPPSYTFCYFFFKDNEIQDSLTTALCALLHQLFTQQPHLTKHAMPAWEKNGGMIRKEANELWRILCNASNDTEAKPIVCILDALDECREADRQRLITLLCEFYDQASETLSTTCWLKFMVTSRPYEDIQNGFVKVSRSLPSIRLRGEDENDQIRTEIDLVIRQQVAELSESLNLQPATAHRIEKKLLHMEHRTYLWLHLAIHSIHQTFRNSLRPDQESVNSLPTSVEEAYEQILAKIDNDQKDTVRMILLIVVGARRALTIGEMALALDVATSPKPLESLLDFSVDKNHLKSHIRQWCGLFLFINQSRLYLIHQTAKEFLLGSDLSAEAACRGWKHSLQPTDIEMEMTRICVMYLCLADFDQEDWITEDDSPERGWRNPPKESGLPDNGRGRDRTDDINRYFAFAAAHWSYHFRNVETTAYETLKKFVHLLYDAESNRYPRWALETLRADFWWFDKKNAGSIPDFHLAARNGHVATLRQLLDLRSQEDIDVPAYDGITALGRAVGRGHQKVVDLLIEKGADVNQLGPGGYVLQVAARQGDVEIFDRLLQAGADINAPTRGLTDLLSAACNTGKLKMVQRLLSMDQNENNYGLLDVAKRHGTSASESVGTTLQIPENILIDAIHGGVELMRFFIDRFDKGVRITEAAMVVAAQWGRVELMKLLLDHSGPELSITEAVMIAALNNWGDGVGMVEFLLDHRGEDVSITDAIVIAAVSPIQTGTELMKLLLARRGEEVRITEDVVKAAVREGVEAMRLLLDRRGDEVLITGPILMEIASFPKGSEVLQLLLDRRGEEVVITEEFMRVAARECSVEMMELLLDKWGKEIQITEDLIKTAAVGRDGTEKLRLLFDRRGAEVLVTEALVESAASGPVDTLRLLLDRSTGEIQITDVMIEKAALGDVEVMGLLLDRSTEQVHITEVMIETAACGDVKVMELLLDRQGENGRISELAVEKAIRLGGVGMMKLLLDRRGDEIQITEDVVMHAARRNVESMRLLLDRRAEEVQITEIVLLAAVEAKEAMLRLLLDRRAGEVSITEAVVAKIAGSSDSLNSRFMGLEEYENVRKMRLLLDRRGEEIHITETVLLAAARSSVDMMKFLLDQRGEEIYITDLIVSAAAENMRTGAEVIGLLLDRRPEEVYTDENLLLRIVWAAKDVGVLKALFGRGADLHITEGVFMNAAGNTTCGPELMQLLLDRRGAEIPITEAILEAAAKNKQCGMEVIKLLLDRGGAETSIKEKVLAATATTWITDEETIYLLTQWKYDEDRILVEENAEEMMEFLLDLRAKEVNIDDSVLAAAAGNMKSSARMVRRLLLDRQGEQHSSPETVLTAAAGNRWCGDEVMECLLDRYGDMIHITEAVVLAAARNEGIGAEVMELLLDRRGPEVNITESVFEAAALNKWTGADVMKLLLDRRPRTKMCITRAVTAAAVKHEKVTMNMPIKDFLSIYDEQIKHVEKKSTEMMELLCLQQSEEGCITDAVLTMAAENWWSGLKILTLLLDKTGSEVQISESVMIAAARNPRNGTDMIRLLLDLRGAEITVTEPVIAAAAENENLGKELMNLFLDRRPEDIHITETVVAAAAGNQETGHEILRLLFDRCPKEVRVTNAVIDAAIKNPRNGVKVMKLLLDLRGAKVTFTEALTVVVAGAEEIALDLMKLLLDRRPKEVLITETVVEAAIRNPVAKSVHMLRLLLDLRGAEIHLTEALIAAAAGNEIAGVGLISLLLDRRPEEVHLTENIILAAVKNRWRGLDMTKLLLRRRREEVYVTDAIIAAVAEIGTRNISEPLPEHLPEWLRGHKGNAGYFETNGAEMMKLLLDRREEQIRTTSVPESTVVGNTESDSR